MCSFVSFDSFHKNLFIALFTIVVYLNMFYKAVIDIYKRDKICVNTQKICSDKPKDPSL